MLKLCWKLQIWYPNGVTYLVSKNKNINAQSPCLFWKWALNLKGIVSKFYLTILKSVFSFRKINMKVGDLNCILLKSGLQWAPNLAKFRKSNMTSQITVMNVTAATLWRHHTLLVMESLYSKFHVTIIFFFQSSDNFCIYRKAYLQSVKNLWYSFFVKIPSRHLPAQS